MPKQVQIKNGPVLTIGDAPFASGGEGDLYKIISPADFARFVVKIYKPDKQSVDREKKIDFLTNNSPNSYSSTEHQSVIWADKIVYQGQKFVGFTMPFAQGIKLEKLCLFKLPNDLGTEWKKFDFAAPKAIDLRQKICFNIAVALYHVHTLDQYVLVDFKPENVMIQSNGLISIIDTDSVQVKEGNQLIYIAPVITPEFTPPEYYKGIKPEIDGAWPTWDLFCLGVIFYRVLCGLHPFVGSCDKPFEHCTSYELKIEHGLFPNGRNRSKFKVVPKEHGNFKKLSAGIQKLFLRCFDDGSLSAGLRPSIEEWCQELAPGIALPNSRKLPSSLYLFPAYNYAKEIALKAKKTFDLPYFKFPALPKRTVLSSIKIRLRIYSEQEVMRQAIVTSHEHLKTIGQRRLHYEYEIQQLIDRYNNKQRSILQKEKQEVEKLKIAFKSEIGAIDSKIRDLISLESKENKDLFALTSGNINALQDQIPTLQNTLLEDKKKEFASQKVNYNDFVVDLQNKKLHAIRKIVNPPNKLAKYVIAKSVYEIFGSPMPSVISNLKSFGIVTADDFVDSNIFGEVKRPNGQWVKVPNLGYVRGPKLKIWRANMEQREDLRLNSLPEVISIAKQYDLEIQAAHTRFSNYERRWKLQIQAQQKQFEEKKSELESQISALHQLHKLKLDELKKSFDKLCADIETQGKSSHDSYANNSSNLSKSIQTELTANHSEFIKQTTAKMGEIQDFLLLYTTEANKLSDLYRSAGFL